MGFRKRARSSASVDTAASTDSEQAQAGSTPPPPPPTPGPAPPPPATVPELQALLQEVTAQRDQAREELKHAQAKADVQTETIERMVAQIEVRCGLAWLAGRIRNWVSHSK